MNKGLCYNLIIVHPNLAAFVKRPYMATSCIFNILNVETVLPAHFFQKSSMFIITFDSSNVYVYNITLARTTGTNSAALIPKGNP